MKQRNLMVGFASLIIVAFGMSGCNGDVNPAATEANILVDTIQNNKLDEIQSFLAVEPSTYSIDPTKDTLIECEKGTQLFFPKNCFAFSNLEEPSSSIEISVKECYEYADFIGENLTTTSNGDLLETGGMIHVTATSGGSEVRIKSNENYKIYFPRNENLNEMDLFYGDRDSANNMNWTISDDSEPEESQPSSNAQAGQLTLPASGVITTICETRISLYTGKLRDYPVEWEFQNGLGDIFSYVKTNFILPPEMKKTLCEYNFEIEVKYELGFDKKGELESINTIESNNQQFDSLAQEFLRTWPPLDMNGMGNPNQKSTFNLGFGTHLTHDYENYSESFEEQYDTEEILEDVDQGELAFYVMGASKLGWINCDRFWETNETKEDLYVNCENDNPLSTYLIFKDIRSIMQGVKNEKQYAFSQIPLNAQVKIIGIQNIDGQPQLCIQEANTNNQTITLDDFQPFNLSELKAEINTIN
ncbi:MAG: hypothetical protein GQ574_21615 [Crocinitomix sp.]|nr:hypothetical protein [Crocinitomix sp.]